MNQIGVDQRAVEIGTAPNCPENRPQRFRAVKLVGIDLETADSEIPLLYPLITKTADFDRHEFGQLARQIFHMDTRASVSVRRVFICQQEDFQRLPIK